MSLPRDGLLVSLALAAATALYLFAFRDLVSSGPLPPAPVPLIGASAPVAQGTAG
jgi:hypothetical protein